MSPIPRSLYNYWKCNILDLDVISVSFSLDYSIWFWKNFKGFTFINELWKGSHFLRLVFIHFLELIKEMLNCLQRLHVILFLCTRCALPITVTFDWLFSYQNLGLLLINNKTTLLRYEAFFGFLIKQILSIFNFWYYHHLFIIQDWLPFCCFIQCAVYLIFWKGIQNWYFVNGYTLIIEFIKFITINIERLIFFFFACIREYFILVIYYIVMYVIFGFQFSIFLGFYW